MFFQNLGISISDALINIWNRFINFAPNIIVAIIIFVIGWFIALFVGKLIAEILKRLKFNEIFEKGNWDEALAKADIKVDVSEFIGAIFKWVLVIVFLQLSVGLLGWMQFTLLLDKIINYLPHVIVAALIFVVTVVVVDIVEKLVRVTVERMKVGYGQTVSAVVRWAIWTFAILMILRELIIVPAFIDTIFNAMIYGTVAFLVISFGLSFGLGGKEAAAKMIEELKSKIAR
ncbi:MAG: hypothetical protein PHF44_00305 [Candidatus Pacebacteria bacterium]|nr:hypothetical protein [Candidatus Paceibacterota bacterium]